MSGPSGNKTLVGLPENQERRKKITKEWMKVFPSRTGAGKENKLSGVSGGRPGPSRGKSKSSCTLPPKKKYTRLHKKNAIKEIAASLLGSWLEQCSDADSFDSSEFSRELVDTIITFLKFYGGSYKSWIMPWLLYTRIFLSNCDLACRPARDIFEIVLVGALITVKFWNDFEVCNRDAAKLFQIPMSIITSIERQFLSALDYNLYLPPSSMDDFKAWLRTETEFISFPASLSTPGPSCRPL